MNLPRPHLAREGWPALALALALALLASALFGPGLIAGACWLVVALLVAFFVHAPRHVPAQAGVVLAPADGRIDRIERGHDPYADREALVISVILRTLSAHPSRACVDGVVRTVHHVPGTSLAHRLVNRLSVRLADVPRPGAPRQERNAVVIDSHGRTVTLVQVAGRLARRILCHARPGQVLTRGQCYGGVRFGSRVDVYLPVDAMLRVAPGDRVSATTSILATLPRMA